MHVPKSNKRAVLTALYNEGVLVAPKEYSLKPHKTIGVPNLHVLMIMKSLQSCGHVTSQFSWQQYYYALTDKGAEYLRGVLELPDDVIPKTRAPERNTNTMATAKLPQSGYNGQSSQRAKEAGVGAPSNFSPQFHGSQQNQGTYAPRSSQRFERGTAVNNSAPMRA